MAIFSTLAKRLATWYRGRYIPPPPNDPNGLVIISPGHYEQPFLAKVFGSIGRFIRAEWKWLLGFIVAVVAVAANVILKK